MANSLTVNGKVNVKALKPFQGKTSTKTTEFKDRNTRPLKLLAEISGGYAPNICSKHSRRRLNYHALICNNVQQYADNVTYYVKWVFYVVRLCIIIIHSYATVCN